MEITEPSDNSVHRQTDEKSSLLIYITSRNSPQDFSSHFVENPSGSLGDAERRERTAPNPFVISRAKS